MSHQSSLTHGTWCSPVRRRQQLSSRHRRFSLSSIFVLCCVGTCACIPATHYPAEAWKTVGRSLHCPHGPPVPCGLMLCTVARVRGKHGTGEALAGLTTALPSLPHEESRPHPCVRLLFCGRCPTAARMCIYAPSHQHPRTSYRQLVSLTTREVGAISVQPGLQDRRSG